MFAAYDTEVINPCDDAPDTCTATPTPTPTATPTAFATRNVHSLVGSRFPQKPYTASLPLLNGHGVSGSPSPNWVLTPAYDSDIIAGDYNVDDWDCSNSSTNFNAAQPNEFDVQFVQGVWQDDMWDGDKPTAFADRTVYMIGSHHASLANLETGVNDTMPDDYALEQTGRHGKYVIGSVNQGVLLKGGRKEVVSGNVHSDILIANGSANFSWLAFDSASSESLWNAASTPGNGTQTPPLYGFLHGSDSHCFIGRRISNSDPTTGLLESGVDARGLHYKESDTWIPGSAIVPNMTGAIGAAWLDMKKADWVVEDKIGGPTDAPSGRGEYGGYVAQAIGVEAITGTTVDGFYANASEVTGFQSVFLWGDRLARVDCDGCERDDSVVRDFRHQRNFPDGISGQQTPSACPTPAPLMLNSVGLYQSDMVSGSGGGSEIQNAALVAGKYYESEASKYVLTPERRAGILNRGDTVLGDGAIGKDHPETTGFDTDVVHVRDVVHLSPRTSPPAIEANVPASDRAGLLYFDAARGTLRVSVPIRGAETTHMTDWKHDAVAWVDVALATDNIKPQDVVLNDPATLTPGEYYDPNHPEDGGPQYQQYIADGLARAREEAGGESPTSPYIAPSLEVIAKERLDEEAVSVTLQMKGFRRGVTDPKSSTLPEIHYCVRTQRTSTWIEKSNWVEAAAPQLLARKGGQASATAGGEMLLVTIDLPAGFRGGLLHLMAIDPENGQTAGTSCILPAFGGAKLASAK